MTGPGRRSLVLAACVLSLVVFAIDIDGCSLVHVTSGRTIEPILGTSESLESVIRAVVR